MQENKKYIYTKSMKGKENENKKQRKYNLEKTG